MSVQNHCIITIKTTKSELFLPYATKAGEGWGLGLLHVITMNTLRGEKTWLLTSLSYLVVCRQIRCVLVSVFLRLSSCLQDVTGCLCSGENKEGFPVLGAAVWCLEVNLMLVSGPQTCLSVLTFSLNAGEQLLLRLQLLHKIKITKAQCFHEWKKSAAQERK